MDGWQIKKGGTEQGSIAGSAAPVAGNLAILAARQASAVPSPRLSAGKGEAFLRIASKSARIGSHLQLFQLLQGDVQEFIPHRILICAWGNLSGHHPRFDVLSGIPGVRTGFLGGCTIGSLLNVLYLRWLTHGRRPLLLGLAPPELPEFSGCTCALHQSLRTMQSVLIHGVHDARDGSDTLYVAMHTNAIVDENDVERFGQIVDPIVAQIDIAFRRISELKFPEGDPGRSVPALSDRELEILAWVSQGRTNNEISKILAISAFTVKNHVQRIIKKLDAANRTEAVAKFRQMGSGNRRRPDIPMRRKTDLMNAAPSAK